MTFENGSWYETEVGDVTPVASKRGVFFWYTRALVWAFYGAAMVFAAWSFSGDHESLLQSVLWTGAMGLPGIWLMSFAYKRIRTGHDKEIYVMAGAGGLAWSVPHIRLSGYSVSHHALEWDQIRTWHPFVKTVNGRVDDQYIVCLISEDKKVDINLHSFGDDASTVADNIAEAANAGGDSDT